MNASIRKIQVKVRGGPIDISLRHSGKRSRSSSKLQIAADKPIENNNNNDGCTSDDVAIVLDDLVKDSNFFNETKNPPRIVPSFDPTEIIIGKELGRGEFGVVSEVEAICLPDGEKCCCTGEVGYVPTGLSLSEVLPPHNDIEAANKITDRSVNRPLTACSPSSKPTSILIKRQESTHSDSTLGTNNKTTKQMNSTLSVENGKKNNQCSPAKRTHNRTSSVSFAEDKPMDISAIFVRQDTAISVYDGRSCCGDEENGENDCCKENDEHDRNLFKIEDEDPLLLEEEITRKTLARHVYRDGIPRYAIKRLRKNCKVDDAAIDLACEAMFLRSISHSNIIHLRATVGTPGAPDFAIMLDRLVRTLDVQIKDWHDVYKKYRGKFGGMYKRNQEGLDHLLTERLLVAFDIARALRHLHNKKILFRDLKPDNMGFNVRGDIQIFDFGLAKELKAKDLVEKPDGFEATGLTGSRRYMPPEVVRCLPYGFKADVYSFSILFWQMIALKTPFPSLDASRHFEYVVMKKKRPAHLKRELPSQLHAMMIEGWSDNPKDRPTFKQICQILQVVSVDRIGNVSDVADRSTHLLDVSLRSFRAEVSSSLKSMKAAKALDDSKPPEGHSKH